jgi:hypothetical protein
MTVFGLGSFFWSLVLGTAISLLLERDGWNQLRSEAAGGEAPADLGDNPSATAEP